MRSLKQLLKVELYLQECFESRNDLAKEALDEQLARFQSLCNKLAEDCIKAFRIMQLEYDETYFVPLMVTGMALVSRLYVCSKSLQEEIPSCRIKLNI